MLGLPAEPGQMPDEVRFEEEEEDDEAAAAARASSGAGTSTSNAAAAAAAGLAAAALPAVDPAHISTTPRPHDLSPTAVGAGVLPASMLLGHPEGSGVARNVLGGLAEDAGGSQQAAGPSGAAAGARVAAGLDAWRGKIAVVTGASSGIGWAVCEALGKAGLRVVAVARRR